MKNDGATARFSQRYLLDHHPVLVAVQSDGLLDQRRELGIRLDGDHLSRSPDRMGAHESVVTGVGSDINAHVTGPHQTWGEPGRARSTKEVRLDSQWFGDIDPEPVAVELGNPE